PRERALHLLRLRDAQDRALNRAGCDGGFTAFIPWSFQPANTALGGHPAGGFEYLRILAASRLILDNIPNIQASWVTQGPKVAQVALAFGANDFGGTMIEENVVRAAGVTHRVPMGEIISAIRSAGFIPAQRDTYYNILREWGTV
ncbi:MAG: dehypoxanthine futalosine cyclase, partial [Actinobacteria bacterium]|nr:dehypoxanthine futalosine cyclase [Actinomycetota bacterium]